MKIRHCWFSEKIIFISRIKLNWRKFESKYTATNKRLGNRLAKGITIGCSWLSARVPAEEQISVFCIYLRL
jgi:hypothetical protein